MTHKRYHFPPGFLWGASTSSHQVEGNNRWNDWWAAEQSGQLAYLSADACQHYERYESDFDLAQSWGHNAHRLSIEWSRIEPEPGQWNPEATAHYRDVIQALRQRGIEPIVTLHHFTNPNWFARRGGWLRRDSAVLFARYADYVLNHIGSEVTYWLTINEPTVYLMQGFVNGIWPPFVRSSWRRAIQVCRRMARAHIAAYQALHQRRADVRVGFAHSAPCVEPCDPGRRLDRLAAGLREMILHHAFFRFIGASLRLADRAGQHLDFLGVNYYTRDVILSSGMGLGAVLGRTCHEPHHETQGRLSDMEWEVYPLGFRRMLEKFAILGIPLMVTENGIATEDETLRSIFLQQHLVQLGQALEHGVPVIGYLYWSLIDNFEWADGNRARFGLAAVDYDTQHREPRPCAEWYEKVCRTNAVCTGQSE